MADMRTQVKDMQGALRVMNFNEITEQGCYILLDTGQLVRVPSEAITPGTSPLVTIHQRGITRAAMLSDNDAELTSTLRAIALTNSIQANF